MITITSTPLRTLVVALLLIALTACGGGVAVAARVSHRPISPYPAGLVPTPSRQSVLSLRAALPQENSSLMR